MNQDKIVVAITREQLWDLINLTRQNISNQRTVEKMEKEFQEYKRLNEYVQNTTEVTQLEWSINILVSAYENNDKAGIDEYGRNLERIFKELKGDEEDDGESDKSSGFFKG